MTLHATSILTLAVQLAESPNTIAHIALTSDEMKDIETHLPF